MKVLIVGAGAMPAHYIISHLEEPFVLHVDSPGGFAGDEHALSDLSVHWPHSFREVLEAFHQVQESFDQLSEAAAEECRRMAYVTEMLCELKYDMRDYLYPEKQICLKPYRTRLKVTHQDKGNFARSGFRCSGKLARGRI